MQDSSLFDRDRATHANSARVSAPNPLPLSAPALVGRNGRSLALGTPCVARLLRRARPLRGHSPAIVEMLRSAPAKNELVREQGIGDGEESRLGGEERVGLAGERCESAQY